MRCLNNPLFWGFSALVKAGSNFGTEAFPLGFRVEPVKTIPVEISGRFGSLRGGFNG